MDVLVKLTCFLLDPEHLHLQFCVDIQFDWSFFSFVMVIPDIRNHVLAEFDIRPSHWRPTNRTASLDPLLSPPHILVWNPFSSNSPKAFCSPRPFPPPSPLPWPPSLPRLSKPHLSVFPRVSLPARSIPQLPTLLPLPMSLLAREPGPPKRLKSTTNGSSGLVQESMTGTVFLLMASAPSSLFMAL